MSWHDMIPDMIRWLVNDLDGSTYSTGQIEQVIVIAAQFVQNDVDFDNTYTLNIATRAITPDPTTPSIDDGFVNLVSIKAACIILTGECKKAAVETFRVVDGFSTIDTKGRYNALKEQLDEMCDNYNNAKLQHQAGSNSPGESVLAPYTTTNTHHDHRFGPFR
jgi:hypothetical protein